MMIATCIGCGCDDMHACEDLNTGGPCSWLRVDYTIGRGVCSACPEDVTRWDAGDHELAVPTDDDGEGCGFTMSAAPGTEVACAVFCQLARNDQEAWLALFDGDGRYVDVETGFWASLRGEEYDPDGKTWAPATAQP